MADTKQATTEQTERIIGRAMGRLLWRRYYGARANLRLTVSMNSDTLRGLLVDAGIPEPDDDLILGPDCEPLHGRTMNRVEPARRDHRQATPASTGKDADE